MSEVTQDKAAEIVPETVPETTTETVPEIVKNTSADELQEHVTVESVPVKNIVSDNKSEPIVNKIYTLDLQGTNTPVFNSCYAQIKLWINKEDDVTFDKIMLLIPRIMAVVQRAVRERKAGIYKKQLVLNLTKKLIQDNVKNDEVRLNVLQMVDFAAPAAIDVLVDVATGNINIKDKAKEVKGFFKLFCCCKE